MFRTAMKAGVALLALAAVTSTTYARETHDTNGHGQHARNTEGTPHNPGVKPHNPGVKPNLVIVSPKGKEIYNDHADDDKVCVYSNKGGLSCNFAPQANQGDPGDDQDN